MSTLLESEPQVKNGSALRGTSALPEMKDPLSAPGSRRSTLRQIVLYGAAGLIGGVGVTAWFIHASHHEVTDDAYLTGHVHSISARVPGTVLEVAVDDNDPVKQGQVLVQLDPKDFQVEVDKAQANYDRAKADFDRVDALKDDIAISKQDYDQTRAAMQIAKANLDDKLDQLGYCTITAPTDGVVGNKTVQTGNRIAAATVLMSVVQDVWVVANYKETQVGRMVKGQRVKIRVDAIPGREFDGRIDSLSPGAGSTFALLPPENATGNFTKIVQRIPVKIVFDTESIRGYEKRLVPGISVETDVDLYSGGERGK